jgi:hypothetical protein
MINVYKPIEPTKKCSDCLNKQKDYKCCNDLLVGIFHNKCYLCEQKSMTDLTTEHFIPHKNDLSLEFSWKNLFLSCSNCNNVKGIKENLIDCTDFNLIITDEIVFELSTTSNLIDSVNIYSLKDKNETINNTVSLLMQIHNGKNTLNSKLKSANIRRKIDKEINHFKNVLQSNIKTEIKKELNFDSEFLAFKIWYIKKHYQNTELIELLPNFK